MEQMPLRKKVMKPDICSRLSREFIKGGASCFFKSIMSIGNLMAGFATGVLPAKIGLKATIITLSAGYELGYLWLGISGWMSILVLSFLLIGFAKGSVINMCTILVSNHSENRAKGMNIMHSCYALGALICPFVIAGAGLIGPVVPSS